ncbi:hypothetical protein HYT00_01685 [Candidatus Giovannonibacteria bacterium]|nr:hypothetical protein [Candidatus Giovannonibacteria bacterium]
MIISGDINKFFKNFFSSANSQAFLLAGETYDLENLLIRHILRGHAENSLDLRKYENDFLKIEDAREIHRVANQKSLSGPKIFLVKSGYIAEDAQSTLLKTIEEPYSDTYFILSGVPEFSLSAPLLSRLTIFNRTNAAPEAGSKLVFSKDSIPQTRDDAEKLFREIEIWADNKIRSGNNAKLSAEFLEELMASKKRFYEKTYSLKMIFEHLFMAKCYFEA